MRVLVCGGRDFTDYGLLKRSLDAQHATAPVSTLIHGNARGADKMSGTWGMLRHVPLAVYPANWGKFGKRAGHLRNAQMLEEGKPDLVLAFPGGTGTQDMVAQATQAGVRVIKVGW